jgi:hypothetical protein
MHALHWKNNLSGSNYTPGNTAKKIDHLHIINLRYVKYMFKIYIKVYMQEDKQTMAIGGM